MNRVLIRGDGIAACCCEHLLTQAGFTLAHEPSARSRLPAIMLSDAAVALIRDVFDRQELFREFHRIRKRVVAWGPGAQPTELEHSAIVVSEQQLLNAVRPASSRVQASSGADWTVVTARPLPSGTEVHSFGARLASALPVKLRTPPDTCWIESLEEGWLFLIPNSASEGWLLAVGSAPETLLSQSRVVAGQIENVLPVSAEFGAFPRIASPLSGANWTACGTAAMAFDPLCGDGTANAVREAILASALISAAEKGGDREDLARHYEVRLTAGFKRHLALCLNFYETGGSSPWWRQEAEALRNGLQWCAEKSAGFGGYRYQLRGFELVPVLP